MIDSIKLTLRDEYEVNSNKTSLSAFFRAKSEELQETIGEDLKSFYPQRLIADRLNISIDQLRNKIYRKKPFTRDWLIAICAAYGLDDYETSEALIICDMPTLDDSSDREVFFVNYLREHKKRPTGINELNNALIEAELSPLDVSFRGKRLNNIMVSEKARPYKEIRPRVVRTFDNLEDRYNSLTTLYLPKVNCIAAAFIEDDAGTKYKLEAHSDGEFWVYEENQMLSKKYQKLDEEDIFYSIMVELSGLVKKRKRELALVAKDSKNYKGRFSANIKNDFLHGFYEEYNYSMPERNEYYFMEYINGEYILSIAHESLFMQEYLSEQEYIDYYGKLNNTKKVAFNSEESIYNYYENKRRSFYPDLLNYRKNAYKRLKSIVEEKVNQIKHRELYIQDFNYIWEIPSEVITYYGVEDEFQCTYDEEYGYIRFYLDEAVIKDCEGNEILISFEDLKEAFELGIKTINDICRLKQKYGTIKLILET